jgi:glycosyltransferase involved in cell wall biosynthesis
MNNPRTCVVVPTYNNPHTVRDVVEKIRVHAAHVIVIDDGSDTAGQRAVAAIERDGLARVRRRKYNGGKGAAVKDGLYLAKFLGFTHVLQIDADGQHDPEDIPRFLDAARRDPDALVLGQPVFDASAPLIRRRARLISRFLTDLQTGGRVIEDPLCGFRVYPIAPALQARASGNAMDFDLEIAVRMIWIGCPVVNIPTRVRYLTSDQGGVSHFRMVSDNLLLSWVHTQLCTQAALRWLLGRPLRST